MRSSSIAARGRRSGPTAGPAGLAAAVLLLLWLPALAWAQETPAAEPGAAPKAAPETKADQPTADQPPAPADAGGPEGAAAGPPAGESADLPADVPVNLRLRRLEQRVQALKERAWRAKARVEMLEDAVLGGGVGATATIVHKNKMGKPYRLVKLVYALDGARIFSRADSGGALHEDKEIEVLTGPIAPGSHTLSVLAIYRGHGYGVFKYLDKYRFTARSSHTFTVSEGKAMRIEVVGFARGGVTTKLEHRPAIKFKVSHGGDPGGS